MSFRVSWLGSFNRLARGVFLYPILFSKNNSAVRMDGSFQINRPEPKQNKKGSLIARHSKTMTIKPYSFGETLQGIMVMPVFDDNAIQ